MTDEITAKKPEAPAQKWWQWLLVYPAVGIAAIGAVPNMIDRALAVYHDTDTDTYSDAVKQREMWAKNMTCGTNSPFAWYTNPSNVKVDATTCPSGDLLVRAMTPDNRSFYHWVALDEIVSPPDAEEGSALIPPARASTTPLWAVAPSQSSPAREMQLAQGAAQVICQHPVDQRIMVRRIQTPQGCFDEFIDMYSGQVVQRRPAPCTPQC